MGFLGWMRRRKTQVPARESRELAELTERVTCLSPRLRLVPRYQQRIRPALEQALDYVRALVQQLPAARDASKEAWASDPYIHAFFGTPHDVELGFSRSPELREFFAQSADSAQAYAVLGMAMAERRTLGVALEGDVMRSDVPQTVISFSDHKVRIIACTEAALREEIVRRLFDQLTLESLARVAAGKSRRNVLEREQALLVARLRLLERQGTGMRSVLGGDGDGDGGPEQATLRAQVAENDRELAQLGKDAGALERQLECLAEVLTNARDFLSIESRHLRLSAMNVLLAAESTAPAHEIELLTARIPGDPPLVRSFALVRFDRGDMLSSGALLDEAARLL
ncbi:MULTISPECIES: hypothetical protein [Cupriavidus]|uniref:Uncharacterized protein n=1 Tax=Cupriavidus taiwanensis TaxID=164546 RepID=A0A9Q7V118_9BURK|nr:MULTISPECIES: hypothetical protein [Cupriavidus]MEC3768609.1 hypothetical protein [Cupriavidus sp. SS-3]SPD68421.1 conserved protein of unknown function [Cupriavidus taiwanensis]